MNISLARLALFHFFLIVYSSLIVGFLLKARFGHNVPPCFARDLRDYGFYLMLLPVIWFGWGLVHANRPRAGAGDVDPVLSVGVVLVVALIVIAVCGTFSVIGASGTLIEHIPTPRNLPKPVELPGAP